MTVRFFEGWDFVAAMKDPLSGNLDRMRVIKGWLDKAGNLQERAYPSPIWYTP